MCEHWKEFIPENCEKLTQEQKEEKYIKMCEYIKKLTKLTPEQREERNKKRREKVTTPEEKEINKLKMREYRSKLTPEQKEKRNKKNREYRKTLTLEQKEKINMKKREVRTTLTREQKDEKNRKNCEYRKKQNPKNKEEQRLKMREYWRSLGPDQLERKRQSCREYYRRKMAKIRKEREQKINEYCADATKEGNEQKLKYHEENLQTSVKLDNNDIVEEFNKDMKQQIFCYTCRMQFLNNSALLEHITVHITLPSVIISRVDKLLKVKQNIKKESENMVTDSSLCSDMPQNVRHIKTEYMEYEKDIKYEFNSTDLKIKTETEIEIDNASFYTYVTNELNTLN